MQTKPIYIFFLGKGGVGKSTSAALAALKYARQHQPVLLVSLDPAHNQSDIFARQFNEKLTRISEFLAVKEINLNQWIQKYLQEVQSQVSRSYTYLTALNLEKYLDVLKYSPGIEEYALLLAFNDVRFSATEFEFIVFDMPPTALALRFLGLPRLTLLWLEKLLDLRQEILKKREIISKIKFGRHEIERDKILLKLHQQIQLYRETRDLFEDPQKTRLILVMNPDKLSLNESRLIMQQLNEFHLSPHHILLNKVQKPEDIAGTAAQFPGIQLQAQPLSPYALIGRQALENYLAGLAEAEKGPADSPGL